MLNIKSQHMDNKLQIQHIDGFHRIRSGSIILNGESGVLLCRYELGSIVKSARSTDPAAGFCIRLYFQDGSEIRGIHPDSPLEAMKICALQLDQKSIKWNCPALDTRFYLAGAIHGSAWGYISGEEHLGMVDMLDWKLRKGGPALQL